MNSLLTLSAVRGDVDLEHLIFIAIVIGCLIAAAVAAWRGFSWVVVVCLIAVALIAAYIGL